MSALSGAKTHLSLAYSFATKSTGDLRVDDFEASNGASVEATTLNPSMTNIAAKQDWHFFVLSNLIPKQKGCIVNLVLRSSVTVQKSICIMLT